MISICVLAFLVVFALLAVLSLSMWLIAAVFPEPGPTLDAAVVAAISTTVSSICPGSRVTEIEEES